MNTSELDQLRTIAPERQPGPGLFTAAERHAVFVAATSGDRDGVPGSRRRPVRTWAYRLVPLVTAGAAAAAAVLASGGTPTAPKHGHGVVSSGTHSLPKTRAVAYVTSRARAALANETTGALRVTTTAGREITTAVEDLGSGAVRYTSRRASDGAILWDSSSTGGTDPTSTVVDYAIKSWYTMRAPLADIARMYDESRVLHQLISERAYVIAGEDIVDGQHAIHLHAPSLEFSLNGKQYAISATDIWVSARTFLPIRVIGPGHAWTDDLSWSSQPPTSAETTAVPPAGFTHLDKPPSTR